MVERWSVRGGPPPQGPPLTELAFNWTAARQILRDPVEAKATPPKYVLALF